ncbi:MAG: AbgT family transporter, partial [Wenzhouxiangella sp.]|nr:AbgT family transporter [Wenzhouxiangella sp.]
MSSESSAIESRNWFTRFLDVVEWLGNLLPHPVTLFALLATAMVFISGLFGWLGVSVADPRPGAPGAPNDAVRLIQPAGGQMCFGHQGSNVVQLAPEGG